MSETIQNISGDPCRVCNTPPGRSHIPGCSEFQRAWRANAARTAKDAKLGAVTRIAFAGAWRADVEAFEMHADAERLPEVDRLLGRCVRLAAQGHGRATADAIDAAQSAAAVCPEVPALAKDVERIIAILRAS